MAEPSSQSLFVSPTPSVRRWLLTLGVGGLIPFVSLAAGGVAVWPHQALALTSLIAYGGSILAFLGALHWAHGLAPDEITPGRRAGHLIWGVIPPLIAWAGLSLPPPGALAVLIGGFAAALFIDLKARGAGLYGPFFIRLRIGLTAGAVGSLGAALALV